jgi:hypothetical protein
MTSCAERAAESLAITGSWSHFGCGVGVAVGVGVLVGCGVGVAVAVGVPVGTSTRVTLPFEQAATSTARTIDAGRISGNTLL